MRPGEWRTRHATSWRSVPLQDKYRAMTKRIGLMGWFLILAALLAANFLHAIVAVAGTYAVLRIAFTTGSF